MKNLRRFSEEGDEKEWQKFQLREIKRIRSKKLRRRKKDLYEDIFNPINH